MALASRGPAGARLEGLAGPASVKQLPSPPMLVRQALVVAIVVLVSAGLCWLMARVVAPGGWTVSKALIFGSFAAVTPWVGFCAANGIIGFAILLRKRRASCEAPLTGPLPRTAIGVTVRNEDLTAVLAPVRRLLTALDEAGFGDCFALFVLSDTAEPDAIATEERAVAAFRAGDRDPGRINYRRRARNDGFKAGNVMDFLRHNADGFALMLVLDADSEMSARAVLRLVRTMRDHPDLGIVQHLTVGRPATAAYPRLFQYGMRAGMRTWASAIAWWQGDECCYWGHNAVLRIAPFRAHCELPLLPGGRHILSHDQVEAAMMAGAGWGVRLLAEEDGSAEGNPPALPEFMRRELRWLAGNLEYWHLLRMPGLRPMGRWQLIQAILLFGFAPLYLLLLLTAAWAAASDMTSPFPAGAALAVTLGWMCGIYAPKLLGYAEVLILQSERARYGGGWRVLRSAATEFVFTLLVDPILVVGKTIAIVRLAVGARGAWMPQNRGDRGVPWREAVRLLWPQMLLGTVAFAGFAQAGYGALLWAVPLAGGLVIAVPLCVFLADPRVGRWLQQRRIAALPEELPAAINATRPIRSEPQAGRLAPRPDRGVP